jgi:uncharacterized membrane protein
MSTATTLARGLGLFSLGLGLYQVASPRGFARTIGLRPSPERETASMSVGVRELAAAGGLLASPRPVRWPWVRVAGDLMDIGLLARAMTARDAQRDRVAMAMLAVVGITAVDVVAGLAMHEESRPQGTATMTPRGTRRLRRSVTLQVSPQEAYDAWRDFAAFPRFMQHVESVRVIDGRRSHWRAKAPLVGSVEWDAEITQDRPGEVIAWQAIPGSPVPNAGRVRFVDAPGDRGTEVHVEMDYAAPLGSVGAVVAKLFGEEPAQQTADDLRRFKQMVETGLIPRSEATIDDRKIRQRPAQPPAELPARRAGELAAASA